MLSVVAKFEGSSGRRGPPQMPQMNALCKRFSSSF